MYIVSNVIIKVIELNCYEPHQQLKFNCKRQESGLSYIFYHDIMIIDGRLIHNIFCGGWFYIFIYIHMLSYIYIYTERVLYLQVSLCACRYAGGNFPTRYKWQGACIYLTVIPIPLPFVTWPGHREKNKEPNVDFSFLRHSSSPFVRTLRANPLIYPPPPPFLSLLSSQCGKKCAPTWRVILFKQLSLGRNVGPAVSKQIYRVHQ